MTCWHVQAQVEQVAQERQEAGQSQAQKQSTAPGLNAIMFRVRLQHPHTARILHERAARVGLEGPQDRRCQISLSPIDLTIYTISLIRPHLICT